MALEVLNSYGSYAAQSAVSSGKANDTKKKDAEQAVEKCGNSSVGKTAADELSYLSNKYDNCTFVAVNYTKGMRYGTNATTNIAISPDFLKKMADNPEMEKEYESYFEDMQRLDEENIRVHAARGRRMVAQGWAIDKNGGISRWGISEPTDQRHYGQEMTDYANKIRKQKEEKRQEQEKVKEKREANAEKKEALEEKYLTGKEERSELRKEMMASGKKQFGNMFKDAVVILSNDEAVISGTEKKGKEDAIGNCLDMKI